MKTLQMCIFCSMRFQRFAIKKNLHPIWWKCGYRWLRRASKVPAAHSSPHTHSHADGYAFRCNLTFSVLPRGAFSALTARGVQGSTMDRPATPPPQLQPPRHKTSGWEAHLRTVLVLGSPIIYIRTNMRIINQFISVSKFWHAKCVMLLTVTAAYMGDCR